VLAIAFGAKKRDLGDLGYECGRKFVQLVVGTITFVVEKWY
jgi:hypothetical protein